jgi:hypothetical protein
MIEMASFYNVLANNIKTAGTSRTREYFQTVIAKWNLNRWLTDTETTNALALVDQYYPATTQS